MCGGCIGKLQWFHCGSFPLLKKIQKMTGRTLKPPRCLYMFQRLDASWTMLGISLSLNECFYHVSQLKNFFKKATTNVNKTHQTPKELHFSTPTFLEVGAKNPQETTVTRPHPMPKTAKEPDSWTSTSRRTNVWSSRQIQKPLLRTFKTSWSFKILFWVDIPPWGSQCAVESRSSGSLTEFVCWFSWSW